MPNRHCEPDFAENANRAALKYKKKRINLQDYNLNIQMENIKYTTFFIKKLDLMILYYHTLEFINC